MKLYATTTSERATKGQGGNKFLQIKITREGGEFLGNILINFEKDSVGELIKAKIDFAEYVYVNGVHWLDAEVSRKKKKEIKDFQCMRCNEEVTESDDGDESCHHELRVKIKGEQKKGEYDPNALDGEGDMQ